MIRNFVCVFFLFVSLFLFSQEPKYVHYTTDDGLPSSEVYDILQDSKGYMWFATDNGVSRFDGYKFHNYTRDDGLLSRTIFDLFEDCRGRIWFAYDNNQLGYIYHDTIFKYKYNNEIELFNNNIKTKKRYIKQISVDSTDNVLIVYSYYGSTYISNKGKLINFNILGRDTIQYNYSSDFNLSHFIIPSDIEYFYSDKINIRINNKLFFLGKINKPYSDAVYFSKDKFVFSLNTNIYLFSNNSLVSNEINALRILCLTNDDGDLWVGTHPLLGALCYKDADITKVPFKQYLKGYSVSAIFRDKENGLWLSTIQDGVFYIPNENFQNYSTTSGFTDNHCTQLLINDEKIIYAGINSRDVFKIGNKKVTKIYQDSLPYEGNLTYQNNLVWIYGIEGNYNINKKNEIYKRKPYYHTTLGKSFNSMYSNRSYAISDRIHLLSTSQGFAYFILNKNGDTLTGYVNLLDHIYINDFCKYKENNILLATKVGLYSLTPDTIAFIDSKIVFLGKTNPKLKERIDKILYNKFDHRYWMATRDYGLFVWDDKKDSIYVISKREGLTDNLITSLYCWKNYIFAGTKFGLCQISLLDTTRFSYTLKMFTKNNGLAANEINDIVVVDSTVYVATDKGICFFNFINNTTNKVPPPVYITHFKINENDTLILNDYRLKYNQNNLTIQFVGLAYKACGDVLYKFQLEGSDTSWHYTKNTELRYLGLPPGNYKFKVFAQNEDGYWSSKPAIINFRILPPFWATLWFKMIVLFIIVLFIFIVISIRLNIIKKRNKIILEETKKRNQLKLEETEKRHGLEGELMNTRLKALNQQMNPHFVFNTLSAVQLLVLKNENELVMEYLNKFARIMRMTLDFSRNEFSSIDKTIEYIAAYIKLKSINLNEEIIFDTKISDNIDIHKENISPMIVQPFVENAIIHGLIPLQNNMKLSIEISKDKDNILFIIEDNGIGRIKAAELNKRKELTHKSYGIRITEERIELITKINNRNIKTEIIDLADDKGNVTGTRVVLNFPDSKDFDLTT